MKIQGKYNEATILATTIEQEAMEQIQLLCDQKWNEGNQIVIMPDVHAGKGCTIGTTIQLNNQKVCPNLVGVDIGCGMLTITIPKGIELNLPAIDASIREMIPCGFQIHANPLKEAKAFEKELDQLICFKNIQASLAQKGKNNALRSLGTLGGGNHFIEIDEDENNRYLVIHTGSRHLGLEIAKYYQNVAIQKCNSKDDYLQSKNAFIQQYKQAGREKEIRSALQQFEKEYEEKTSIPNDLCYLSGQDTLDYYHDMAIVTKYASLNRQLIAKQIMKQMNVTEYESFETIHNYIDLSNEVPILRKGAIATYANQKVIIPINMKDGSIIAIGKGNEAVNFSGPHGAGRLMSRKQAKELIQLEDFQKVMAGIYSTSVQLETIDESPFAYKGIEDILPHLENMVDHIQVIHPIYNFKAS